MDLPAAVRPVRARAVVAIALCIGTLPVAGCGGPSAEARFRTEHLVPAQQRIEAQKSRLSTDLQVVHLGRKRDAGVIGHEVNALAGAVRKMDLLEPPKSVVAAFQRYKVANAHLVKALHTFAAALGGHSNAQLNRAGAAAQAAAGEIARTRDALDALLTKK